MDSVNFSRADLSRLQCIKMAYTDLDEMSREIKTEVKYLGDKYITVFFKCEEDFNINYPQQVYLRFICDGTVYAADSALLGIKRTNTYVFLTLESPKELVIRQNRRYYRIKLDRVCILLATNNEDHCEAYMSRTIDISAGGVLLYKMESMYDNSPITMEPNNYKCYNIVLILGLNTILKLSARYVRHEQTEKGYKCAFEFMDVSEKERDMLCKFVAQEEVEQLKLQKKIQEQKINERQH